MNPDFKMCDKTIKCKIDVVKTKLLQSVFGFCFWFFLLSYISLKQDKKWRVRKGNIVAEILLPSGPDKIAASVCGCVSATLHCH